MKNWKTTVAGILSAIIATVGPVTAYLATTNSPKAATATGIVTLVGAIARIYIGLIQSDAHPSVTSEINIQQITPEPPKALPPVEAGK
jgi:hypothetical protein